MHFFEMPLPFTRSPVPEQQDRLMYIDEKYHKT